MRILFLLLFFLAEIAFAEANFAVADSAENAFLTVNSDFNNLEVFLDQVRIGETPIVNYSLSPGSHKLVVRSPKYPAWNYPDYKETFTAASGDSIFIQAVFPEKVLINSVPAKARVIVNGEFIGTTPLLLDKQQLSFQAIELLKEGFDSYLITEADLDDFVNINLQPNMEWLQEDSKKSAEKKQSLKNQRKLMLASMGLAALSGLATLHFRSEGNSEYSKYLRTAYPEEMNRYFNQAQKYDRLSGISYAIFEVSFVMTGYFFLKSRD